MAWATLVTLVHLIGLVLAVGAATAKLALLVKCRADPGFVPTYLRVARPISSQIIVGMALLLLSGIGWLLLGYAITPRLALKIGLFVAVWILGPIIDNVVEPRFKILAPEAGQAASGAFIAVQRQYLALEIIATLLFYAIVVIWVFR